MKRILSVFLAFVMVVIAVPMTAVETAAATEVYYSYTVSDGEATITDVYTSISGDVTIPSKLGGYPVTSI